MSSGSEGLISDGVVVYVNASIPESYTSGASLMKDLSGSSATFNFSTGPPVLSDNGIDLTQGGNALKLSEQVRVQTISLWYSRVGQAYTLLSLRPQEVGAKVNGLSMQGDFFTGQTVYIDGVLSTVTDFVNIPENVWVNVVFVGDYLSALTSPILFGNYLLGAHYHATFRSALFYNRALTAQEIAENYATSLNYPDAPLAPKRTYRYQLNPPSNDFVASLRVKDLDSLNDGDTISSWGAATAVSNPIYKNDSSFSFPYVMLDPGFFNLGQRTIQPSLGFTFTGLVYTTSASVQYPLVWSYAVAQDDGLRLYRTGGTGEDLVFRSQKAANVTAIAPDETTVNTWQVFTNRITDNGDSTFTMDIFVDNVLQGTTTSASSDMSGIVNGLLEVGQSSAWTSNPVSPIYVSDFFFYDRSLSDTELGDMHTYFSTMGDAVHSPFSSVTPRALSVAVSITEIAESTGYRLTSQQTGSPTIRMVNAEFTDLDQVVGNLKPETEYTLRLLSTTGSGYELVGESVVSTLVNSAGSYDVSEFGVGNSFDLSSLNTDILALIIVVMNDLFSTGDTIEVGLKGAPGSHKSKLKFVNRGSTVDVSESEALIAPFVEDAGSGQTFDMTLSDSSTATVAYDETTNSVTINSTSYAPGDAFVLDGKKVVVHDL